MPWSLAPLIPQTQRIWVVRPIRALIFLVNCLRCHTTISRLSVRFGTGVLASGEDELRKEELSSKPQDLCVRSGHHGLKQK